MEQPVNLKKLAEDLNLSVSTVSKALRDSYEISEETKQRVLDLAAKLNYLPNPYASGLRQKKSKTIAIVIPEVADNFFSNAINAIEKIAQEKGYHTLIYLSHESAAREQSILREFRNGRVDGVIISVSSETTNADHILSLTQYAVPVVLFDRVLKNTEIFKVTTNDYESAFQAVQHLIDRSCRNIAFLSNSKSLAINQDRFQGYLACLKKNRLEEKENLVVDCSSEKYKQKSAVTNLLTSANPPDGILASVESLAFITYQVCEELNLNIPKDVKIICFSNLEIASILNPALSTITQPAEEMGKEVACALFKMLENKTGHLTLQDLEIPSVLMPRKSTT